MNAALRILLSAALAALLLALLAVWGDVEWSDFLDAWRRLPPSAYGLALGLHVAVYNLRAWRYRLLLPAEGRPGHADVAAIAAAHNMATYVLPARSGDASLPVYLRAQCGVPLRNGVAALVVSRLLDLATLAAALGLACAWLSTGGAVEVPGWMAGAGGVLLAAGGLALFVAGRADRIVPVVQALVRGTGLSRTRAGTGLLRIAGDTAEALRVAGRGRTLLRAGALTVLVWLGLFLMYAVLARGFGLPDTVDFAGATFGAGMAILTNLLPINAFASFGTHELGWAFGFGLVGVERDLALSTGLNVHLVQVLNVCLLGLIGHLAMGALASRRTTG